MNKHQGSITFNELVKPTHTVSADLKGLGHAVLGNFV